MEIQDVTLQARPQGRLQTQTNQSNVLAMRTFIIFAALAFLWLASGNAQEEPIRAYVIQRPTILAFFPPVNEADLDKDPDTNEVLGDFQLYATRAVPPLKKAGIDFEVVSAVKFKVKNGATVRTFRTGKIGVGYYFVEPGKQPHVEFGVMTDDDILAAATKYFKIIFGN